MAILVGIPVLALTVILQSSIFSRVHLLNGSADIVLLVVACWALNERVQDEWVWALMAGALLGFISAAPVWLPIVSLLAVTAFSVYLKRRVWNVPVLALFVTVFVGSLGVYLINYLALAALRTPVSFLEAANLVILPGMLLNLLLALPVSGLIGEIAAWLYPDEIE